MHNSLELYLPCSSLLIFQPFSSSRYWTSWWYKLLLRSFLITRSNVWHLGRSNKLLSFFWVSSHLYELLRFCMYVCLLCMSACPKNGVFLLTPSPFVCFSTLLSICPPPFAHRVFLCLFLSVSFHR